MKRNTFLTLGLALAFYIFFMTTKHAAALSDIIPFANDPYDAVGSFAVQAAAFLGLLACLRTITLWRTNPTDRHPRMLLARTQMAVVLAVLLTLVADSIAMLRHVSIWTGKAATGELLLLMAGLTCFAILVGVLVLRPIGFPRNVSAQKKGLIVFAIMVVVLVLYPEDLTQGNVSELFTVVIGAVLLFVPMWAVGVALLPERDEQPKRRHWLTRYHVHWILVVLLGLFLGLLLVLGELRTSGGPFQLLSHLRVVLIYVGLETAGLLIGYSFLRKQLGLF